jgi:hypothetical protein
VPFSDSLNFFMGSQGFSMILWPPHENVKAFFRIDKERRIGRIACACSIDNREGFSECCCDGPIGLKGTSWCECQRKALGYLGIEALIGKNIMIGM